MKINKFLRLRPGLTASELMVVLGLFGILTTGVMSLFSTSIRQWSRGSGKSEADDVASVAVQRIVRLIEGGKSATTASLMTGPALSVRMPIVNDQGDYDRTGDGDTIYVYLWNGKVHYKVNSTGTAVVIATGVQSFSFTPGSGTVTLTLAIARQSGMVNSSTSFTQRVALRNYTAPV